jgi:mitochondrial fission protein ELM1
MNILTLTDKNNVASQRQTGALAAAMRELLQRHGVTQIVTTSDCEGTEKPDLIITAGQSLFKRARALKQLSGARLVQIQYPDSPGQTPVDLTACNVVAALPYETLTYENPPGPNVIPVGFALSGVTGELLATWRKQHCKLYLRSGILATDNPVIGIMVGGSDSHVTWNDKDFATLGEDIYEFAVKNFRNRIVVMTSRRTGERGENILRQALGRLRNLRINEPASSEAVLGRIDIGIVTADSHSMFNELWATGVPIHVATLRDKLDRHPVHLSLQPMLANGDIEIWQPSSILTALKRLRPASIEDDLPVARKICHDLQLIT